MDTSILPLVELVIPYYAASSCPTPDQATRSNLICNMSYTTNGSNLSLATASIMYLSTRLLCTDCYYHYYHQWLLTTLY